MCRFASINELIRWLSAHNIDTTTWGHSGTKTIGHLWVEIQRGESQLFDNPPCRVVRVAELCIRRSDRILFEMAQTLEDGSIRFINRLPSEKLLFAEDPCHAALRCLREELAIAPDMARIAFDSTTRWNKDAVSLSYPNLRSIYTFSSVRVFVDALPDTPFVTHESVQNPGDPVTYHHWEWKRADGYHAC